MLPLVTNILKYCWTRGHLLSASATTLRHTDRIFSFYNKLSTFEGSVSRSDLATVTETNSLMKKTVRNINRYITKCPENTILLWIGNVPSRVMRKKLDITDASQLQSLYVRFSYRIPHSNSLLEINLIRPLDERFSQTCDKIREKIHRFLLKQTAKEVVFDEECNAQFVFSAPNRPDLLLSTNEQVYKDESMVDFLINNNLYRISRNPPRCAKLALKLKPLVGCPVMASFSLADDSPKVEPLFHWYVGEADAPLATLTLNSTAEVKSKYAIDGWIYRTTSHYYCPGVEDVGKRICVIFDMGEDSITHCIDTIDVVSAIDETFIFEDRQSIFCQNRADNSNVRVMSYNILADLYLDLKCKQEDLYFPYCSKEHLDYTYRYPVLLREIPGYQADIIFLQEVDERLWFRFLPKVMCSHGYDCYFKRKGLKVNEGLVICYRKEQFRYLESYDMWLPDLLNIEIYPENADVIELLERNEELKTMFVSKPAVVQVLVLNSNVMATDEDDILLLANTHLYFNPLFEIIKILQSLLCARWIRRVAADYAKRNPKTRLYVLFAGDFNSTPDGAVYQLLSTGSISAKSDCITYSQLDRDVTFTVQPLSSTSFSLTLTSLADETQFTNYTRHYRYDGQIAGFEGCLDYIWGSANVEVQKVIPVPPKELAKKYVALPSKISPSDHLPLVCDVRFR